jgi:anti-sigma B factor antagonist
MAIQPYADGGRTPAQSDAPPPAMLRIVSTPTKAHTLGLTLGRHGASVRLTGEIDIVAAADVARLMDSLEAVDGEIHVDLSQVSFMDSSGLQLLIDVARRRQRQAQPPVLIDRASRPVRRLLNVTGVGGDPTLDVDAWDQFNAAAQSEPLPDWRQATADRPWSSTPQVKARGAITGSQRQSRCADT